MWTGRRLGNGEKTDKGEEDSAERSHSAQIRAEGRAGSSSFYFKIPFETECVKNSKLGAAPGTDTHTDRKEAGTRQVETENPRGWGVGCSRDFLYPGQGLVCGARAPRVRRACIEDQVLK